MLFWRSDRRRFQARRLALRAVSCLLLANWLLLALGIPLPAPLWRAKDRSRPFPCMNSPCGCHTAEACWRECCCFSNEEKLAWAKRNGVVPPAYVVAAAKGESEKKCCKSSSKTTKSSCCPTQHSDSVVDTTELSAVLASSGESFPTSAESNDATSSNCSASLEATAANIAGTNNLTADEESEELTVTYISLSSWHRCHGTSFHWLADVPALPPTYPLCSILIEPGDWLRLGDQHSIEGDFSPPVPPPRVCV